MTVLDQAQNFSGGPVAAARQRDRWARREANATDDEVRESYREAIADLEARYPDIADVPVGGAEAFARERGHGTGARSPVHEGRNRRRPGTSSTSRSSKAKKPTPPTAAGAHKPKLAPPSSRRQPARGRATPHVDRAIRQTGIPSAVDSSGSTLMAALGATVGVALLYLVLSSAETPGSGAAALPRMIGGVTRALGRFLSLQDIFPGPNVSRVVPGASPVQPRRVSPSRVQRKARRNPAGMLSNPRLGTLANPYQELMP